MIRIIKPVEPPTVLVRKGLPAGNALRLAYESGNQDFDFNSAIYGDKEVKTALILAQHGKCCFCERKIHEDGDVEHFRPKGGISQGSKEPMEKPGYYWLAYDWSNLLLSCSACNSRHKRNLFPLANTGKRVVNHFGASAIHEEEPLFIDPSCENPAIFIGFDGPVPYAIDDNTRGAMTIQALGLNRIALVKIRRDYLNVLKQVHDALLFAESRASDPDWLKEAAMFRAILDDSQKDDAEFAAMARSAAVVHFEERE